MKPSLLWLVLFLFGEKTFAQWNSNTSINLEAAGIVTGPISTVSTPDDKTYIAFYSQVSGNSIRLPVAILAKGNYWLQLHTASETISEHWIKE